MAKVPLLSYGGPLVFQVDDTYAQKSLPIVNQAGLKSEQLSKKEVKKKFPQIDLNGLKSFYFEHEAGYLPARHCCQVVLENFCQKEGENTNNWL